MKVVIAIDSFKGSLTSIEAGKAAAEGIKKACPDAATVIRPVADGGEGTVEALVFGMGGTMQKAEVTGPLGEKIKSEYGIIEDTKTAIIEMSAAAGITLVSEEQRNPLNTTTYGVGEMIKDAIEKGCRNFIIGIGGSATNDGGIGMLQALGFGILDKDKNQVSLGAKGLKEICSVTEDKALKALKGCTFNIACDVTNPLCGENGCSAVYGPQKGADKTMIEEMDKWLLKYAETAKKLFDKADPTFPGAGAAGGIGFAFMTFLKGKLRGGIDLILKETRLEEEVETADLVITGEGRLDFQTAMGKAPAGIAGIAKKYNKPVIAFSGCATDDAGVCNDCGIDAFFPILRGVSTLEDAMNKENARKNMALTAEQAMRLFMI